ncbi:MAG: leucine--tRNA ligase [Candidatus Lightella neohaematopini]|nr:leucine--tRNA ligase [Candidatus Lightella neohaematopini]
MFNEYNHKEIEYIVQQYWQINNTFKVNEDINKEKYYCLSMLPYPSGNLHIGHIRNYTVGDIISRYNRMLGKNVLYPIGWDAFGLPAEEAAIKNKIEPEKWTRQNISYMRKQLKMLGFSYDWSREIITCNPEYYRWEQLFFIYLYNNGLAYKKKSLVNWCPNDNTVLANEQVIDNRCWRCNTIITYKNISQWFLKITNYADELLNSLDKLNDWPIEVKNMQRNWIGKVRGIEIKFKIFNSENYIKVYTNNIDNIMETTCILINIKYFLAKRFLLSKFTKEFINKQKLYSNEHDSNQVGIPTGMYAIHPISKQHIPIWLVNNILTSSTNSSMLIPSSSKYDLMFANKYNLNKILITRNNKLDKEKSNILINLKELDSSKYNINKLAITNFLLKKGYIKRKIFYRIRDWCISRQRYWGVPIPMITLDKNIIPVPHNQLPIVLPKKNIEYDNPLLDPKWYKINYNNKLALRETDTFDTFMESSWYYIRYTCPNYNLGIVNSIAANYWLPVDQYIGGIEHAIMHLIYFRFYHKLMRDANLINCHEPVKKLLCQGMVLSNAFYYTSRENKKIWISPDKVKINYDSNGNIISINDIYGNKLRCAGAIKMSKSKNNGVNPVDIVNKYGADALRLFLMFSAPVTMPLIWCESGILGINRFLKKVWKLTYYYIKLKKLNYNYSNILKNNHKLIRYQIHSTIQKVTYDIEKKQTFNTAISELMKLTNTLIKYSNNKTIDNINILKEGLYILIKILYPFAPHICFVLWKILGNKNNIDYSNWPSVDKTALVINNVDIIFQINGKFKGKINVPVNSNQELVYNLLYKKYLSKKNIDTFKIKNIIFLYNKLINVVI